MNAHFISQLAILGVAVSPLVAFWLFSAVVSTMPNADEIAQVSKSAGFILFYKWIYNILHFIAGNAAHVIPSLRIPVGASNDPPKV